MHKEKAQELFKAGYNCSQAILGAFCEEYGMDFETAMKMSVSFGGGMGRMREVCGTVSGMFMVLGLAYWKKDSDKSSHYKRVQKLAEEFKKKNGSIICKELLKGIESSSSPVASERTEQYYKKRPCVELVGDAADILDEYFAKNPVEQALIM